MLRRLIPLLLLLPAALPCTAAPPKPAATPAPSVVYTELMSDYMDGKWDNLEKNLEDKRKDVGGLPAKEAADIAALRPILAECRPTWWNTIKTGKAKIPFHPAIWGHNLSIIFDPENPANLNFNTVNGHTDFTVQWVLADMDNRAPAEHGFSKGDLLHLSVFNTLGMADAISLMPPLSPQLDDAGKAALNRYLNFRASVTGLYYATPAARRWGFFLYLLNFRPKYEKDPTCGPRKAAADLLLDEILSHPETYPSIHLPAKLAPDNAEEVLASQIADYLEKHPWTFAEDNALRTAIKTFAAANLKKPYDTGLVTLPNKLMVSIDPEADKTLRLKRDAWIKLQYDKAPHKE